MKVSIITVVYNSASYLRNCIESVLAQDYQNIEYILIDGASTDNSFEIAKEYKEKLDVLISEPDKGMYDALNKGISLASGEVIGVLHADDLFASDQVISEVVKCFEANTVDAVYGNLNYVSSSNTTKIERKWLSKQANRSDFEFGWMPAHPTLYIRSSCFKQYGGYKIDIGSTADYELILRFFYKNQLSLKYLPLLMVNMRSGGMSNATFKHRWEGIKGDFKAIRMNDMKFAWWVLACKKLQKIVQFVR